MEHLIIAITIGVLTTMITLVMVTYRRDCAVNRRRVEQLDPDHLYSQWSSSGNAGCDEDQQTATSVACRTARSRRSFAA